MINLPQPPEGILDPQVPWSYLRPESRVWNILKARLTGRPQQGENYSSYVNISEADADRLIANMKKDPRGYPSLDQSSGTPIQLMERHRLYQEWLVEEYLEKPFRKETDAKIEERALESRMKEIDEQRKEKAKSFVSGATSFRPGKTISAETTSISSIIPKRTIPQQIVEKISSSSELGGGETEPVTGAPKGVITSLGKLTLNLEQSNNNLEKIIEVVKEDYKTVKETNKKEIEDYRKRVANRGRILGKKELGSDKVDLAGIIKKYVGSFFSGTGGAIRALAGLNLIEGIMTGDPMKILGSLTGITASYLPAIGMAVGGKVAESLGKRLFLGGGRRSGGILRGFGGVPKEAKPITRLARGGGRFALGAGLAAGALAIGGKIFGGGGEAQRVSEITNPKQDGQGGADVLMPKDSLKRFDDLNTKFEQAINMLLNGGGGPGSGPGPVGGGGSTATIASIADSRLTPQAKAWLATIRYAEGTAGPKGYTTMFGGGQFTDLSHHPDKVVTSGGYSSAAAGAYQFMPDTWASVGGGAMTPERQDRAAIALAQRRGVDLSTAQINAQNIAKLSKEWASLPTLSGTSAYGQPNKQAQDLINYYNRALAQYSGGPPPTTPPSAPVLPAPGAAPYLPSPGSTAQRNIQPFPVASAGNAPSSATSDGSEGPPAINTTYYENFLALYSKLIYQIV